MAGKQPFWPEWVARHFARHAGPEDEPETNVNGDPDSHSGEETEEGFEEMSSEVGWEDPSFEDDDDEDEPDGAADEE
jgi:hypothetical protein